MEKSDHLRAKQIIHRLIMSPDWVTLGVPRAFVTDELKRAGLHEPHHYRNAVRDLHLQGNGAGFLFPTPMTPQSIELKPRGPKPRKVERYEAAIKWLEAFMCDETKGFHEIAGGAIDADIDRECLMIALQATGARVTIPIKW